ncbi:MAG TPA: ABC transporter substrate-binding protein, partial [Candidatus Elarobacter sp.]|nr:ABC transporter substrate-binding protein [Candidatus Elarobacter sp.]
LVAPGAGVPARAAEPGTVTITQGVDATTLDPLKASVTTDTNVQAQLYDTLARRSPDGSALVPQLATSWKRIAPAVWEFKLRRGVTFSNGDPFTSADVKFTVEKILDPAFKSQQVPRVDTVARVETPDPYTVHFVTKRPTPLPPAITRPVFIADAKFWQEHGDAYMVEHPMGTGPYVLKSWRRDEALELDANPRYWGGAPPVAHVIFKPIPEAGTRVSALRTGATDLITNVPFQYATLLAGGTATRMASARSVRVLYIAFNTLQPGPQPMYMLGWGNITYDADNTLSSQLVSDAVSSTYANPAVDKLTDAARYELDPAKRKALYAKALRIIHDDAPWLFLFQYEDLYATSKRLQWQPRPDEGIYCTEMRLR